MATWQSKLTKKELQHVREWGGRTLAGFKHNRAVQLEMKARDEANGFRNTEPCWDCRTIARKLGLE